MSNTAINIRIVMWFFQITFDGKKSWSKARYWAENPWKAWLMPIAIYDFSPSKIRKVAV